MNTDTTNTAPRSPRLGLVLATLALAVALPVVGEAVYRGRFQKGVCLVDKLPIQPIYRTVLSLSNGRDLEFGSPRCALMYLKKHPNMGRVVVVLTDEVTGRPLPPERAWVVRSDVQTSAQDGNRLHVFADEVEARRHALQHNGEVLDGPFAAYHLTKKEGGHAMPERSPGAEATP